MSRDQQFGKDVVCCYSMRAGVSASAGNVGRQNRPAASGADVADRNTSLARTDVQGPLRRWHRRLRQSSAAE